MMSSFTLEILVRRREPYAVHFVSGKKHVIVLANVYMTIYTMLNKIFHRGKIFLILQIFKSSPNIRQLIR